jgi:hypothetical protein
MPISEELQWQWGQRRTYGPPWSSRVEATTREAKQMGQEKQLRVQLCVRVSVAQIYGRGGQSERCIPVPIRLDGGAGDLEETARTEVADNLIMHASGAPYLVAILAIKQAFEWE